MNQIILKEYGFHRKPSFNTRSICTANVRNFIILPDGKVTICEELYDNPQFIIGDLTKQAIMEVWNSPKEKELFYLQKEYISKESVCHSCSEFKICREARGVLERDINGIWKR
nr:SPASM domain-containing protein [uncultured Bacteroides sp.]